MLLENVAFVAVALYRSMQQLRIQPEYNPEKRANRYQ
jgi:hypothetical protein